MRAFISYSWDSEAHKDWVRSLANRLITNGVDTILDQYDLEVGADRFVFMETASRQADVILFVCTPEYVLRANERRSGVGAETILLATQFFATHRAKRFIPILRSTNETTPYTPDYLASLIFVDFRDNNMFDRRVEELLRHLHGQPKYHKPALGKVPTFGTASIARPGTAVPGSEDHELVVRLIAFLEDRRVLFSQV
jgi:TIR domain